LQLKYPAQSKAKTILAHLQIGIRATKITAAIHGLLKRMGVERAQLKVIQKPPGYTGRHMMLNNTRRKDIEISLIVRNWLRGVIIAETQSQCLGYIIGDTSFDRGNVTPAEAWSIICAQTISISLRRQLVADGFYFAVKNAFNIKCNRDLLDRLTAMPTAKFCGMSKEPCSANRLA
jgi:hypothetical protein